MSKRKQMQIPGTERKEVPEIETAAEAYREVRDERAALSKRESMKRMELLAIMRAHGVKLYRYLDNEGLELEVIVDDEPTVRVRKTGEEGGSDEGVVAEPDSVHPGLIEQAMKAQAEAGVVETPEGDVVGPETNGEKKKRKGKAGKGK